MDLRFENLMSFGMFGRELLLFEYLDISLDLTGIYSCIEKILPQQQISLKENSNSEVHFGKYENIKLPEKFVS